MSTTLKVSEIILKILAVVFFLIPMCSGDHMSLPMGLSMIWGAMSGDWLSIIYFIGLVSLALGVGGIKPKILILLSLVIFTYCAIRFIIPDINKLLYGSMAFIEIILLVLLVFKSWRKRVV